MAEGMNDPRRVSEANDLARQASSAREAGNYERAAKLSEQAAERFGGGAESEDQMHKSALDSINAGHYDEARTKATIATSFVSGDKDPYHQQRYEARRNRVESIANHREAGDRQYDEKIP